MTKNGLRFAKQALIAAMDVFVDWPWSGEANGLHGDRERVLAVYEGVLVP